jgi:hypothetical protein
MDRRDGKELKRNGIPDNLKQVSPVVFNILEIALNDVDYVHPARPAQKTTEGNIFEQNLPKEKEDPEKKHSKNVHFDCRSGIFPQDYDGSNQAQENQDQKPKNPLE